MSLEPMSSMDADEGLPPMGLDAVRGEAGHPLDEIEVKGILQREIEDSLGGLGSQVSEERRTAIRLFYGRPLGNEIKDRSQVVMMDVLEVIEWTMPSLMAMFTGGMRTVRYTPKRPDTQHACDIATAVVNDRFYSDDVKGFQVLYDWFKTCLMEKNGFVETFYEERHHPSWKSYTGLTDVELMGLMDDESAEPVAHEEYEETIGGETQTFHDLTMKKIKIERGVKVEGIPPEEFLIARRTIKLDDKTAFCGRRRKMTISDLVELGHDFEEVANLPNDDSPEYSQGRTERLSEDETYPISTAERMDPASRELWVTDCIIRIDEDGDGYAELRRIRVVGEQSLHILSDEIINRNPFSSITPVPMPHKFFGQSLADLVADLQIIRSTIMRQILDHLYLSTNPRLAVVEGQVNLDDLLTVRPGGLVRQRQIGMIEPIQLPNLPREAFEALTYLEEVRTNRTGILAHGKEVDASAINSTATGLAQLMAEKQQKIALIGRILAETGLQDMFYKFLCETIENATKAEQVHVAGEWVEYDAREWDIDMGCEVEVGLGAAQAIERLSNLDRVRDRMGEMDASGLGYTVTPANRYNLARATAEAAGFKNPDLFFTDPASMEPPPPQPDPEMEKLQFEVEKSKAEMQLKAAQLDLDRFKETNLVRHRAEELAMNERMKLAQIESQRIIALGQQEATEEAARISAEAREGEGAETEEGED